MYADWITLLTNAGRTAATTRYPQNVRRFLVLILFAVIWPALRGIALLGMGLDHLLYPDFTKVEIKQPLFIVGNLRTGSTLMYRTLAADTQTFVCFRMVDMFLPAICMKRAFERLGRLDATLGRPVGRLLTRLEARALADWSRIHETGFLQPEEDELSLLVHLSSAAVYELFPHEPRFRRLLFMDEAMERAEQERVMAQYRRLVQRQLYHAGPHKQFLSKNPLLSTKINALLRAFPDARFVTLVREPVAVVASSASLFHFVWHRSGAVHPDARDMSTVLDWCEAMYQHPERCLAGLPPDRALTLRYDDLIADPGQTLRAALTQLGLAIPPSLDGVLHHASARQRQYRSPHRYATDTWGVSEAEINRRFQAVTERYGLGREGR